MQESRIEFYFKKQIEKIGGKAFKLVSPGTTGVPDRMVLLPLGNIIFVEMKAPGKKLRPMQVHRVNQIRSLGFRVEVIDCKEEVDRFVRSVNKNEDKKN